MASLGCSKSNSAPRGKKRKQRLSRFEGEVWSESSEKFSQKSSETGRKPILSMLL